MLRRLKNRWRTLGPWARASVLAIGVLLLLHAFVFRWVTVRSTSMYATLLPGDLLLVQRWPVWTGFERGDIVVFRDPLRDDLPMHKRPLLVKRIAGRPGDTVELRRGRLMVNGTVQREPPRATWAWLVRLRMGHGPEEVLSLMQLPAHRVQPGRMVLELPLNDSIAALVARCESVVSAEPMGLATGAPPHIFPHSPRYRWNSDDYGPLAVPARGDTLHLDADNLPLYDRLISHYEGHDLAVVNGELTIDGIPSATHVVRMDHYFVLGDSRHHSADSRYTGFVPHDHLVGRVGIVVWRNGAGDPSKGRSLRRP
jgi:signal peptidase I